MDEAVESDARHYVDEEARQSRYVLAIDYYTCEE